MIEEMQPDFVFRIENDLEGLKGTVRKNKCQFRKHNN